MGRKPKYEELFDISLRMEQACQEFAKNRHYACERCDHVCADRAAWQRNADGKINVSLIETEIAGLEEELAALLERRMELHKHGIRYTDDDMRAVNVALEEKRRRKRYLLKKLEKAGYKLSDSRNVDTRTPHAPEGAAAPPEPGPDIRVLKARGKLGVYSLSGMKLRIMVDQLYIEIPVESVRIFTAEALAAARVLTTPARDDEPA